MSRFKSQSEEKMADLDHETNNRRGGGYAPGDAAAAAEPSAQDEEAFGPRPAGGPVFLVRHAAPDRKGNQNACKI